MLEQRKDECVSGFTEAPLPPKTRKSKHPSPISLRLSPDERALLERDAGNKTLSAHIREQLFGESVTSSFRRPARKSNKPNVDHVVLAKLLGLLGKSRLSQNMNQIAKAAHMGALPVSDELEAELALACQDIKDMRDTLISAMGRA
ncbi:hypothetical protein [Ponticaulis sp.]|uniref:hypothetical protein n=1 Tax=Ponticaulis sp. TaxID=2020902 RepID=UPI0025DF71F6|nr:hypothetical protein [Ponticaulis sp.]|tara:strand:- start:76908 stop:77345 length:438 start_codon:yes stop_codon:yes gene_type:complete